MSESLAYLTVSAVQAIHTEVLRAHGGSPGIRDLALLESAVAAPQATMMGQLLITDPIEIAAAYLFYICGNHPFVDGNKRAAFLAVGLFLGLNDFSLAADQVDAARNMLALAAGEINEEQFAEWVRAHMKRGARRGRGST